MHRGHVPLLGSPSYRVNDVRGVGALFFPHRRGSGPMLTLARRIAGTFFFSGWRVGGATLTVTFTPLLFASLLVKSLFVAHTHHSLPSYGEDGAKMRPQLHLLERMTLRAGARVIYGETRSRR